MKNKFTFLLAPAIFCWCLFCIQGCKDTVLDNKNLLTKSDAFDLARDTFPLNGFSVFEQPINSTNLSTAILGNISDPNFGKTNAGFYAQSLLNSGISFGPHPVLDSAVLMLGYTGQYGAFTNPVNLIVFELNQDITSGQNYYTNDAFAVKTPAIGQVNGFVPNLTDSVPLQGGALPAHLRVTLSQSFGNRIVLADTNTLADKNAFMSYFKGVYVTTTSSPAGNGMLYFNLFSELSGIKFFYHNDSVAAATYVLPLTGTSVNHFDNNYAGTPVYTSVNSPNPAGEQKIYVQAGVGVKGKIMIPDFDSIPKKVGINKAELILTQSATDTAYPAPLELGLLRIDGAGIGQFLEDQSRIDFGGVRVTETVNGVPVNRYRFNITRYFQKLVQGIHQNNGFFVQTASANSNSERVVIADSSTDKNYQLTLVITYTKL